MLYEFERGYNATKATKNMYNSIRTLWDANTSGQSGPESDGNKEVLHIPQSFSITRASPSYYLE